MPFVSDAQRRWMFANEPEMAQRWQEHTPKDKDLPERVGEKEASAPTSAIGQLGQLAACSQRDTVKEANGVLRAIASELPIVGKWIGKSPTPPASTVQGGQSFFPGMGPSKPSLLGRLAGAAPSGKTLAAIGGGGLVGGAGTAGALYGLDPFGPSQAEVDSQYAQGAEVGRQGAHQAFLNERDKYQAEADARKVRIEGSSGRLSGLPEEGLTEGDFDHWTAVDKRVEAQNRKAEKAKWVKDQDYLRTAKKWLSDFGNKVKMVREKQEAEDDSAYRRVMARRARDKSDAKASGGTGQAPPEGWSWPQWAALLGALGIGGYGAYRILSDDDEDEEEY